MKRVLSVSLLTLCLLIPAAYADETEAVAKAQRAATAWLALTYGGKYAESWDSAAALIKAAITKPGWEKALKSARSPLGASGPASSSRRVCRHPIRRSVREQLNRGVYQSGAGPE